jgi:hypothetical protein
MVSSALSRTANPSAVLLLTAIAFSSAGFSQSRFGADAERQQQIIERIQQEESRNGPYSEALIGPLSDLALIYQDRGDHDLAVAVITRVRQLVRANEGLHSLEQIPLIQQMIANEEAIGRVDTAWELEQDLLTLARRHPGDLRTVPVFRETAAKRMALLRQYLAGEFPPQMLLGCYYGWPRQAVSHVGSDGNVSTATTTDCNSGQRDNAIRAIVSDAQRHYADAIAVMLRNERYSSDELRELELEVVRSLEVIRARASTQRERTRPGAGGLDGARLDLEPWRSWMQSMALLAEWELPQPVAEPVPEQSEPRDGAPLSSRFYERDCLDGCLGRHSLQRLLAYEIATSAPFEKQVEAYVRIADWEQGEQALERYERAVKMLHDAGAHTLIDELFAPKTPVVLPTFVPNPLATDETQTSIGYIDVAFEITDYGKSRRIQILDTTTNASDSEKARLFQLIENSRFRPRLTDGEFARASPVVLRYYLTE